jgi:hypothetical protein
MRLGRLGRAGHEDRKGPCNTRPCVKRSVSSNLLFGRKNSTVLYGTNTPHLATLQYSTVLHSHPLQKSFVEVPQYFIAPENIIKDSLSVLLYFIASLRFREENTVQN